MKKLLTILVCLVLVSSFALAAQEQTQEQESAEETIEEEQVRERNQQRLQTGLQNALTRVKNENARQRLQQNLERFLQKYQERMQRMQGVEIEEVDEETGAVKIKAKEQVKYFGLIKGTATKRFEMDRNGKINEKAPWYKFLYTENKE